MNKTRTPNSVPTLSILLILVLGALLIPNAYGTYEQSTLDKETAIAARDVKLAEQNDLQTKFDNYTALSTEEQQRIEQAISSNGAFNQPGFLSKLETLTTASGVELGGITFQKPTVVQGTIMSVGISLNITAPDNITLTNFVSAIENNVEHYTIDTIDTQRTETALRTNIRLLAYYK